MSSASKGSHTARERPIADKTPEPDPDNEAAARGDLEAGFADIEAGRTYSNDYVKRWVRQRAEEIKRKRD